MKIKNTVFSAIATLSFANSVNAAPVQYIFTGSWNTEQYQNYTTVPVSQRLFSNGTPISMSFFYDASTPATATDFPAATVGAFNNFGNMSQYDSAATQFSGTLAGYQFGADAGRVLVSDAEDNNTQYYRDGVFLSSGTPDVNFAPINGSLFQEFQVGNFTLVGLNLYEVGSDSFLSSQALPDPLQNPNVTNGLYLTFVDTNNTQQWVRFFGTISPAPVPVPSTALLLGSSLIGLFGLVRKRKAN